jgi:hypothetical protein
MMDHSLGWLLRELVTMASFLCQLHLSLPVCLEKIFFPFHRNILRDGSQLDKENIALAVSRFFQPFQSLIGQLNNFANES